MPEKKYELGNLVFSKFESNECCVGATDQLPEDVEVDLTTGMWSWKPDGHGFVHKIGEGRCPTRATRNSTIGVYDLTDIHQVDLMISEAAQAVERPVSIAFSD